MLHYLDNGVFCAIHHPQLPCLLSCNTPITQMSWDDMLCCYCGLLTIHWFYNCTVKMKSNAAYRRVFSLAKYILVSSMICMLKIH